MADKAFASHVTTKSLAHGSSANWVCKPLIVNCNYQIIGNNQN